MLIGVTIAIVVIAGGCVAILKSSLGPLERSADDYLHALGAGDGRAVCSSMTRIAQDELAATYKQDSCRKAVDELLRPLTATDRERLSNTDTRSAETKPPLGYVDLGDNPLRLSQLVLTEIDGNWLVTQLR
ncbi:hypothetical protein [Streptomyces sp. CC216C]|uniref:hypothetical protein n=1 Tax=Streptomyces sp. CC216C TaxID=3044576 RepID=UPI0024A8C12E|nr:hypothetical protein [Streptomyces sp. CC216C]